MIKQNRRTIQQEMQIATICLEHSEKEFERRSKIEFWRGFYAHRWLRKLLTDIRGVVVETPLDNQYLSHWIAKSGLQSEWQKAQ
jgi:hypothetical protein